MTAHVNHWTREMAIPWLVNPPGGTDHKYTRGVLGVRTGSPAYPGAAVLGVEAAWRTGLGMVRYLPFEATPEARSALLHRRPETVFTPGRADAWLVGSGIEAIVADSGAEAELFKILRGTAPLVIDAGAIPSLTKFVETHGRVAAPAVITPHTGEFNTLSELLGLGSAGEPNEERIAQVAAILGVTVLLKGSVTRVATPSGATGRYGPATPWLATAGTGDVLGGILGALVAKHHRNISEHPESLLEISLSAALLHDAAARTATAPFTALDVAEAIPQALHHISHT